jgi:preprotein translocase subunit SecB
MVSQKIKSNLPSGAVNLNSVQLSKSFFSKGEIEQQGNLQMEFSISSKEVEQQLFVSEKIKLSSEVSSSFSIEVEMIAEFEKAENFSGSIEDFSNINAAAIIYAYVRQHVSNLSLQAGMNPIVLPIINFFEHYQKSKKS